MKIILGNPFQEYVEKLPAERANKIKAFFAEFDTHCLLKGTEKKKLRNDFERAIMYYAACGTAQEKALELIDVKNLGGFYARPAVLWFPLDDAAKVYPLSMEHGTMTVFRMSVYMKEPVVPELLQMALNFSIKRFPSFATTLKKGMFWHYLDTTKRRFCVEQEKDIPCSPLKVSYSGSQSFRVLYWQNRISIEFFHVLTDGTGGLTFLKVLAAEYVRLLKGVEIAADVSLWDIHAVPSLEEFENAFAGVPQSDKASGFVGKSSVQMNGRLTETKPYRIIHFKMQAARLKEVAQSYGTTVTGYMLGLMFFAGKAATDELQGDVNIQVPVDMRKFYPSETVRNFSMYCGIRIPLEETGDLASVIREINLQLEKKASKEAMVEMLTATERTVNMIKYIPLAVKQPVAKMIYGFVDGRMFSNTFSNLGVVKMPRAVSEHIESMDVVLGPNGTNRAGCSLVTFNGTATFTVTKTTADPSFEEKMFELLQKDGIAVEAEGSGVYEH